MGSVFRRPAALGSLAATLAVAAAGIAPAAPSAATARAPGGRSGACPSGSATADPVPELDRAAHPLATTRARGPFPDLGPLGRMVGNAQVVGVGEATHGSDQFFTLKDRVFRYLVRAKRFQTFALEADWRAGLRINDYVLHGEGDIRQIMRQEFQSAEIVWDNREYLDLFRWMRGYDKRHAAKVEFMGDDIELASPAMFATVTGYLWRHYPWLFSEFARLYRGQVPRLPVGAAIRRYRRLPLAQRHDMAVRAGRAYNLLRVQRPAWPLPRFARVVQQARVIAQVARFESFNFNSHAGRRRGDLYRDRAMADNVLWWRRHVQRKIVLSAHNGHVAYVTNSPQTYPRPQGAFLRDHLGRAYVNILTAFDQGSFNAINEANNRLQAFTVGPAPAGSNEHTLRQVRYRDYLVDMRTVGCPARQWLEVARPTWDIGSGYSARFTVADAETDTALRPSADLLIFVAHVDAAHALSRVPVP